MKPWCGTSEGKERSLCGAGWLIVGVLTLLLFSSPQPCLAEEKFGSGGIKVSGYVRDLGGTPIKDVFVGGTEITTRFYAGAATNEDGYYEFQVDQNGTYSISAYRCNWSKSPYVNDYIPAYKDVDIGSVAEVNVDFTLRPAGNIILHAYDNQGKLLRNKQLTTATNGYLIATDLKGLPEYGAGSYRPLHDSYTVKHDYNPDLMLPNFVVSPGVGNQVHLHWEVPKFGKITVSIDNEGKGYNVPKQGGAVTLNFNLEAAKSKLASLQKDFDLCKAQGYTIPKSVMTDLALSKQHLAKAKGYLKGSVPNMKKAVSELNISLKLSSYAHENLLLAKAGPDIEKYRKGDATITVVDDDGKPVPNCDLSYNQTSHDFLFAVFGVGFPISGIDEFRFVKPLKNAGVNFTYAFFDYKSVEPEPGTFDWSSCQYGVEGLLSRGMNRLSGFPCFYANRDDPAIGEGCSPLYWDTMTLEELNSSVFNHMQTLVSHYSQAIKTWQAVELPHVWTNPLGLTWNEKFELIRAYSGGIKAVDPSFKIVHVADAVPFTTFVGEKAGSLDEKARSMTFYEFIGYLVQKEIPIDLIGLEFIYANNNWKLDLVGTAKLLDLYADFNKPIYLHEFAVPSCPDYTDFWWHRPWDKATQAEFLRGVWTIAFSKPLVQEVAWSYAVSDYDTYVMCGGLFDATGKPKPSYYAMKNLIKSWTTKGKGKTDANGQLTIRGFGGDYKVTASVEGNPSQTIRITEQNEDAYTIKLPIGQNKQQQAHD